jgi:DNA-binding transcriptional LysR family regulator
MALSSHHLEAFLSVARLLNFTQAAKQLNVTQSALSQRILNLEEELGTTLFIRERRGLLLTETANELLRYCTVKDALENEFLEKLKTRSQTELVGVVRVAGFSSVMRSLVLPSLAPIIKRFPNLRLELKTRELSELMPLLQKGEVDFIITDRKADRADVKTCALGVERAVLVEKKGYDGPEVYLDHDEFDSTTFGYFKVARKRPPRLERRYLDDIYGVLDGVKAGLGRAVISEHLVHKQNDLKILNPEVVLKTSLYLENFEQPYYSRLHEAVSAAIIDGFLALR